MTVTKLYSRLLPPLICLCLLLLISTDQLLGQEYMTESGHAEFDSSVPLHSFTGKSDFLVGKINLDDNTIDFYLDVNTLKTGINKRDKDMRETLNSDEYPFAEFFGKLVTPFDPEKKEAQKVTAEGEFSIHGETKKLKVEGYLEPVSDGLRLNTAWTINMTDFNIEPPGILFYRVSEEIDIRIDALLTPN